MKDLAELGDIPLELFELGEAACSLSISIPIFIK